MRQVTARRPGEEPASERPVTRARSPSEEGSVAGEGPWVCLGAARPSLAQAYWSECADSSRSGTPGLP